jgi:transcriptional regulator with XRE-family HTH domain
LSIGLTADEIIGPIIAKRRIERGVSQEKLGKLIGVHLTFISRFETGRTRLRLTTMIAIARALEIDPLDLFAEIKEALRDQLVE